MRLTRRLLPLLIVLSLVACRHNVNTNNPKVIFAVTLLDASNATVTIEDGLTAADHVLDELRLTEPEYYSHAKPLIQRISAVNRVAALKIQAVKNGDTTADWKGALVAVGTTATPADLTTFGFKNKNTQLIVQAGFATLISGLSLTQQFGGAH